MKDKRDISIRTPFDKVHQFLSEAENLPKWTTFFQQLISIEDGICIMKTPAGISRTYCEVSNNRTMTKIKIISNFDHKTETATIFLKKFPTNCHVTFHLKTPPKLDPKIHIKMLKNLEKELLFLKNHLENLGE